MLYTSKNLFNLSDMVGSKYMISLKLTSTVRLSLSPTYGTVVLLRMRESYALRIKIHELIFICTKCLGKYRIVLIHTVLNLRVAS